jgi:hypothetical protein
MSEQTDTTNDIAAMLRKALASTLSENSGSTSGSTATSGTTGSTTNNNGTQSSSVSDDPFVEADRLLALGLWEEILKMPNAPAAYSALATQMMTEKVNMNGGAVAQVNSSAAPIDPKQQETQTAAVETAAPAMPVDNSPSFKTIIDKIAADSLEVATTALYNGPAAGAEVKSAIVASLGNTVDTRDSMPEKPGIAPDVQATQATEQVAARAKTEASVAIADLVKSGGLNLEAGSFKVLWDNKALTMTDAALGNRAVTTQMEPGAGAKQTGLA